MRALMSFFLVSLFAMSSAQTFEYQRQIVIPNYPADNLWELALQNADIGIRPADISAVAECLREKWPNPILGEAYVVPDECLPGAPIQAVGSLDDLAVQAARVSGRPVSSEPTSQMTYFAATASGGYQRVASIDRFVVTRPVRLEIPETYTVQTGESFESIVRRYYKPYVQWMPEEVREITIQRYVLTVAFKNRYHNGEQMTKVLKAGDVLDYFPPANPIQMTDASGHVVGWAHYQLRDETTYFLEQLYPGCDLVLTNYNNHQTGAQVTDQQVGSLYMLVFQEDLDPRLMWVKEHNLRNDAFHRRD